MTDYKPSYDDSHALVIGINSYEDRRFMPLGEAEADARAVADLLAKPPYAFKVDLLLGKDATRRAILSRLFSLRSTKPDDRILIYFAGHGYTLTDNFGHETGYLAAADTIPEQDFTALELDEVTDLRRHAAAKHIVFVFDACFSGQALGLTRAPSVAADKFLQRRAFQVLSAGAGDQPVSDAFSMTNLLIEALEEDTVTKTGLFTLSQLGLHLQQTMTAESKNMQIPQFGHLRGSQGGEFIFYMATGPRLPADLEMALVSQSGFVRWGAVAELIAIARGKDATLTALAREWLERMAREDPDERVQSSARRYLVRDKAPVSTLAEFNPPTLEDLLRESGTNLGRLPTEHATSPVQLKPEEQEANPYAILFFSAGPAKDQYLVLTEKVTTIGRTSENKVPLVDTRVSRHHAQIEVRDDGNLWIVDLGSTNGTFVNDERLTAPRRLKDGDYIRIGKSAFAVYLYDRNGGLPDTAPLKGRGSAAQPPGSPAPDQGGPADAPAGSP